MYDRGKENAMSRQRSQRSRSPRVFPRLNAVALAVGAELSEHGAAETSVEPADADAVTSAVSAQLSEQGAAETSVEPAGANAVASAVGAELSEQGAAETSVEPAGADAVEAGADAVTPAGYKLILSLRPKVLHIRIRTLTPWATVLDSHRRSHRKHRALLQAPHQARRRAQACLPSS